MVIITVALELAQKNFVIKQTRMARINMNNEIELLESISAEFYQNGDIMDELLVDREVSLISRMVSNKSRAIEIGCGNGYSTERLVKVFDNLLVIEPSKKNIELMQNRIGKEIETCNALLEDFHTDEKFDNIIFLNVLEHVVDPVGALMKIESLLSDDGQVFICVPNCMSLNRRAGYEMGLLESYDKFAPKDILVGHRRLYTVEMLAEHIEEANLVLDEMRGIYLKPLAESQMINLGMDAVKAFYLLGEDAPQYCANLFAVAKKKK